jgi:excisionase family DNA binding protein
VSTAAPEFTVADWARLCVLGQLSAVAPRFLTIDGAAAYTSLSSETIRRLIETGKLQPLRPVKGRIVIDRHALDQFITSSTKSVRRGRGIR